MSSIFVRYEQREYDGLCQQVCELDDRILAVTVVEDGELVGTCLRKGFPFLQGPSSQPRSCRQA